jgi:glycerophosphoryl diester phosphodiesterase
MKYIKMLKFKSRMSIDKKKLRKNKYSSVCLNLIKHGLIVVFGIMLFSCKSNKKLKSDTTNRAIEKISELSKQNILVCAHRSYHKMSPENSLQSLRDAIETHIDIVELDIRTTKDSILVLMHDNTINRTTIGIGKVKDYTFSELQQFNLKIGDSITTHKIPLASEALKILKGRLIPNLDLKAVNYYQLYKMLQELEMEHEVISYIGRKEKVMKMIGIDSLFAVLPLSKTIEEMILYSKNTKSTLQHLTDESFTKENMKWAIDKGELIFVNTLWDEDKDFVLGNTKSMDNVIELRPTIIQTDHPKLLVEYLRKKGLHK